MPFSGKATHESKLLRYRQQKWSSMNHGRHSYLGKMLLHDLGRDKKQDSFLFPQTVSCETQDELF